VAYPSRDTRRKGGRDSLEAKEHPYFFNNVDYYKYFHVGVFNSRRCIELGLIFVYYLVSSVCERVIGLIILILVIRYYGDDYYYFFSLNKFVGALG